MDGCGKVVDARELCGKHYARWKRTGSAADPVRRQVLSDAEERLWCSVTLGTSDECWPWTGYVNEDGYGRIRIGNGKRTGVHRYSYELAHGPIPEGFTVDHECHNSSTSCVGGHGCLHRRCTNPAHLSAKPILENVQSSSHTAVSINRSKTHCPRGHEYDEVTASGSRWCSICRKDQDRGHKQRRRDVARLVSPSQKRYLTEAERAELVASYTGGRGEKAALARRFGISKSSVGYQLRMADRR